MFNQNPTWELSGSHPRSEEHTSELQYFGHLMRRADSLEKTLMLGGIGLAGGERSVTPEGVHEQRAGRVLLSSVGVGR